MRWFISRVLMRVAHYLVVPLVRRAMRHQKAAQCDVKKRELG
jgi:hypothetical protein